MLQTELSTFDNSWYDTGASLVKRSLWYFVNVVIFRNPFCLSSRFKVFLLRCFGAKTGKGIVIKPEVNIKYPWKLSIGNNVWIGEAVWIISFDLVQIGDNCCLSQGAMLIGGSHNYKRTTFDLMIGPIVLENGVWIGAKAIVCHGVTCKSHSILAVNSVLNTDMEPYSIYRGNPTAKIRDRIM